MIWSSDLKVLHAKAWEFPAAGQSFLPPHWALIIIINFDIPFILRHSRNKQFIYKLFLFHFKTSDFSAITKDASFTRLLVRPFFSYFLIHWEQKRLEFGTLRTPEWINVNGAFSSNARDIVQGKTKRLSVSFTNHAFLAWEQLRFTLGTCLWNCA